jgi:hypothetical protein
MSLEVSRIPGRRAAAVLAAVVLSVSPTTIFAQSPPAPQTATCDTPPSSASAINANSGTLSTTCAPTIPQAVVTPISPLPGSVPQAGTDSQTVASSAMFGAVRGEVATCQNSAEQPAAGVTVQAEGTSATTLTNEDGDFSLTQVPAPAVYTIAASSGDSTTDRQHVPVAPGETIDIGMLQFGAGIYGCGNEDQ